jgi:hypothetical protein
LQITGWRALCAVAADRRCIDEYAAVRANRFALRGRARWIRPTTLAAFSTDAAATAATVVTADPAVSALGSSSGGAAGSSLSIIGAIALISIAEVSKDAAAQAKTNQAKSYAHFKSSR